MHAGLHGPNNLLILIEPEDETANFSPRYEYQRCRLYSKPKVYLYIGPFIRNMSVKLQLFSYPSVVKTYVLDAEKKRDGSVEYPQHMFWFRF